MLCLLSDVFVVWMLMWHRFSLCVVFFQAEDGIRDLVRSRGLGDVYKIQALRHGIGKAGAKLVMMAGVPFGTPGSTNVLHVATLTGDELRGYS